MAGPQTTQRPAMTTIKRTLVWAERLCAVVLALFWMLVSIADSVPAGDERRWIAAAIVAGHVAVASGIVACIVIGQRGARTLRIVGWSFLLLLLAGWVF